MGCSEGDHRHGTWRDWGAPFLSFACLVHCVGAAVLAPLLPTVAVFAENELLEVVLWSMTAVLTIFLLWRRATARQLWLWLAYTAAAATGIGALVFEAEAPLILSLLAFATLQITTIVRDRARRGCGTVGQAA